MTEVFGAQTVSFVTLTGTGVFDEFGYETTTETVVPVEGCRHRPLRANEAVELLGNVATQVWKTTAPAAAEAVVAASTGTLREGGRTFHILGGAQPFEDMDGVVFKVTILSEIQEV